MPGEAAPSLVPVEELRSRRNQLLDEISNEFPYPDAAEVETLITEARRASPGPG